MLAQVLAFPFYAAGKGKPVKAKTPHTESIATETAASTAADFSLSPRQAKGSLSARTITEEVTTATSIRSAIQSSVPEEISSRTPSPGKRWVLVVMTSLWGHCRGDGVCVCVCVCVQYV